MASLKKRGKNKMYYAQYYENGKQKRVNLNTTSEQFAKDKIRQIESAQFRQEDIPLPTKTSLPKIIEKYIFSLKAKVNEENVKKVVSYLRLTFGSICDCLAIKNDKIAKKAVKRPSSEKLDLLEVSNLEQLTTEQVAKFLSSLVVYKGISTKTVNHYRQNILTLCNWAMTEGGVKFPGDKNPVSSVKRYKEIKSDIRFLKLNDITEQLEALSGNLLFQTMVAVYIYAGLRRAEALWLMPSDFDWNAGNFGVIRIRNKVFNGKKWVPKTRSNRTVPISSALRQLLDKYLENFKPGTWFFSTPEGCKWDSDNFSTELRSANNEAALKWTCLDFRHTFGSHLASKGESLYKISKLMGNSPQVCEKHYAFLMPECLYESVEFSEDTTPPPSHKPTTPKTSPIPVPETLELPRLRLVVNNK